MTYEYDFDEVDVSSHGFGFVLSFDSLPCVLPASGDCVRLGNRIYKVDVFTVFDDGSCDCLCSEVN